MINTHILANAVRSFASPWIYPRDTRRNPDGIVLFWCFFLPRGGGELFSFGNDFARPRGRTQRICSRQWDKRGEKCYDGRCVKMQKHWMHLFVIFSNEK